ncbi:makorin, ring finger protein, 4 isoform X2 [Gouania willdenowi]|uniref:makorin, ring finger protein, 4 isoform X2 n=1 Tax=Gouania willdenowi TaxID=441366 RepID=UPI0010550BC9|nr:E3 ubiquitin-protein ligase makorin-1-like isoform X2 [Gouania willdenowi]
MNIQFCQHIRYVGTFRKVLAGLATVAKTDAARRGSVPMVSSRMVVPVPPSRRGSEPSYVQTGVRVGQDGNSETLHITSDTLYAGPEPEANVVGQPAQEVDSDTPQTLESTQLSASSGQNEEPSSFERSEEDAGTSPQAGSSSAAAATFNAQSEDEVQRPFLLSNTIICGICMELVYEKLDPKSHVFGILPNCNHPFCLQCIKTWRKSKDFAPDVVKTCPQCRVNSPFYVPNKYWVEGPEKQKVIAVFKEKVGKKSCSFYARSGSCPFKKDCLYRHDRPACHRPLPCLGDDDEDEDFMTVELFSLLIAMTLLDGDDDELLTSE